MMGEAIHHNLMVDIPPWTISDDQFTPTAYDYLLTEAEMASLQRYLPANESTDAEYYANDLADPPIDTYSCDEFRMYVFKIRRCARGRSHDWTECPYAHPGEKARRRDPKIYTYSGTACPDFRKGSCKRGDGCEYAHGVFECWLHPARYRTQACKDGIGCRRRVCFFAHTPEQLRVVPQKQSAARVVLESYDGSPMRLHAVDAYFGRGMMISPPMSPKVGSPVKEVLASLRKLQLNKVKSFPCSSRDGGAGGSLMGAKSDFYSLPTTPMGFEEVGEEGVQRVESGRALRAKMYERFSKESGLGQVDVGSGSDVGWVSELVN